VPSILNKFDSDLVRYYLAANMPEGKDSDFSWDDFDTKINNELVATLGNYYHRVLSFTQKNYGEVPVLHLEGVQGERESVNAAIAQAKIELDSYLSTCQFKKALKVIMDLAQFGNIFFNSVAPWALFKTDREKCGSVLNLNLELVKALAIMTYPFLPRSAAGAWEMLGMKDKIGKGSWTSIDMAITPGQKLELPKPLFAKIILDKVPSPFQEFSKLNLRIATIKEVSDHPDASKLYVLKLDAGKEVQLVAGIKGYYTKDQLIGKKIVYISNLQPAKLRGVESQGMLLAAEADGKVFVLTPGEGAEPGDPVNSGMEQGEKLLTFQDFQKFVIRTGHTDGVSEVDIGRKIRVQYPTGTSVLAQAAVFLPSADANEGLPLFTSKGIPITVDGELKNGAQVR
jgi:methionyl-tRNA synthetase